MKKKAFTLTELLVVVVIIGVLSAVVLPKFNKVIESRRGGQLPTVSAGDGCTVHHAYYNSGKWWSGGIRITGNYVYGSDQDWCDNNCGSKASCNTKGIISQSAPNTCGSYHCSNGWHCDNAEGTGVALECIRE